MAANPLVDPYGVNTEHDDGAMQYGQFGVTPCNVHLAMILLASGVFIALLRYWGFRAMVGVGR